MRAVTALSDDEISEADAIHTADPHDPNAAGHQLWGHRSIASQAVLDSDEVVLEVGLPSDDHVALLALIDRIERVKGRLPPDVEVLRRNLSA
jgi:hypothetical protein